MPIYTVQNDDGTHLDAVAARNQAELNEAVQQVAPGRLFDVQGDVIHLRTPNGTPGRGVANLAPILNTATTATVTETAPAVELSTDPEIPFSQMAPCWVRLAGENWHFEHVEGGTRRRAQRKIFLRSAPLSNYKPGTTPSRRARNIWQANPSYVLDRHAPPRLLLNQDKKLVWVFGHWRQSYKQVIEELLGYTEFVELTDRSFTVLEQALERAKSSAVEDQKQQLDRTLKSIRDYQLYLTQALRDRNAIERMLAAYKPPETGSARRLVDRIMNVEGVASISVNGDTLHVLTETIFIEVKFDKQQQPNLTRYDIGKFKISVDIVTGHITLKNLTRQVVGREHPHVRVPDAACFGEITASIPELVSQLMLPELVRTLLIYLRSVDPTDVYGRQITEWPLAKEQPRKEEKTEEKGIGDENRDRLDEEFVGVLAEAG